MMVFESPRFYYREHTPGDARDFYHLNSDPEVLKFTGDKSFGDEAEAREFLVNYSQYREYGMGRWAIIEKSTGDYCGWCGIRYQPEVNAYDLGFRLFRKMWGQGIATEAAEKSADIAFRKLKIQRLFGRVRKENTASIKVLHKIGMIYQETCIEEGHEILVYTLDRP